MKKQGFIVACIFTIAMFFSFAGTVRAGEPEKGKPLQGKKVLFVWGGWHGHEPEKCKDIFVPWMESEGAEVIVSDSLGVYSNEDLMGTIDLVVQTWTMGKISKEQEKGLLKAVKKGVGIAGWHGGLGDSFRNNTEYQFMVGGQWVAHPGGVIDYSVDVPEALEMMKRGIRWAAESKYEKMEPWMSPVY